MSKHAQMITAINRALLDGASLKASVKYIQQPSPLHYAASQANHQAVSQNKPRLKASGHLEWLEEGWVQVNQVPI